MRPSTRELNLSTADAGDGGYRGAEHPVALRVLSGLVGPLLRGLLLLPLHTQRLLAKNLRCAICLRLSRRRPLRFDRLRLSGRQLRRLLGLSLD